MPKIKRRFQLNVTIKLPGNDVNPLFRKVEQNTLLKIHF
jgi:hypothetical protein